MGSKFEESPLGESVESYIQSDFTINGFYGIQQKNQIKIFPPQATNLHLLAPS